MKKTLRTLMMGMMALLAGNALTSCNNGDELQTAPESQKGYVEFSLSRGADTRTAYEATTAGGLDVTWSEGDMVVVEIYESNISEVFKLKDGAGSNTATFYKEESELAGKSAEKVTIEYMHGLTSETDPDEFVLDFSQQDGKLESLGKYDWFGFEATLTNGKIENPVFKPYMSILKFPKGFDFGITATEAVLVFCGGSNNSETSGDITIQDVHFYDGKLDEDVYVAICTYRDYDIPTFLKVGGKTFLLPEIPESGKIYTLAESNLREADTEPLTLEAIMEEFVTKDLKVTIKNPLGLVISYKIDGGEMVSSTEGNTDDITFTVPAGKKVQLFGDNTAYAGKTESYFQYTNIQCEGKCYIYGNIMSLINAANYATETKLIENYTFSDLFMNNTHIMNHESKALTLPATKLTEFCYFGMFIGCTSLTTAPELPATTLAKKCYYSMFIDCTSLTTAPALPATTMADYCYQSMFANCTSLTTAPTLPAKKLETGCYSSMFEDCSSLKAVTCLATDISAEDCTRNWLNNVASNGTFTKAKDVEWSRNVDGIPSGWDVVEK